MGTAHLWVLALASFVLLRPTGAAECSLACPTSQSSSVLKYQTGNTYIYSLEGTTVTSLSGSNGDPLKVQLKASAELSVLESCGRILRVKNVQIIGTDSKKYTNLKELEAHSVLASFQGGSLNDRLCAEDGEEQTALNIKRAVLSLLQVSTTKSTTLNEVDIFGNCPTEFRSTQQGDVNVVKKTRNLNRCSHREDLKEAVPSTQLIGFADIHSAPLLDASLQVEQKIKGGVIQSVNSRETYLYQPFSNQGNGAKTIVETKLTLVSSVPQAPPSKVSLKVPHSINFETPHGFGGALGTSNVKTLLAALQAAELSTKDDAHSDAATKFRSLVDVLRHSSKEDILTVYSQVKSGAGFSDKRSARSLLMDAIFFTGTGDSVQVIVELLKVNEITSKYWYQGLGFVRHASLSSLTAVGGLLDQQNLPTEALLGIGALTGRYCREHRCDNVPQFNEIISKLSKRITLSISSKAQENNVIAALKALGNIHHLNDDIAEKLQKLSSDNSVPTRVRVAALQAFQSDPCRKKLNRAALELLKNKGQDSEIRIRAYLAAFECPNDALLNTLKDLLETETINQVGSFVASHLQNLKASTNPGKTEAKQKLKDLKPQKQFKDDVRKYSRNYELSYILDYLNIGTNFESNVIFSQNSFLPRSVSLNVSTEMFGHSYNILELDARAENLDHILESYLGPKGYFNTVDKKEPIKTGMDKIKTFADKIRTRYEKSTRHKRSVNKEQVENLREQAYKSLSPSQRDKTLNLDLAIKTFGSEVAWLSFDGINKDVAPDTLINKFFENVDDGVERTKEFHHDVRPHFTFLDSELVYPTGLGFALKLVATGTAAAHIKLNGEADVEALLKDPLKGNLQLELIPSAAVEVDAQIVVDAYSVESGLEVDFTLHTATGITLNVKNLNGLGVDVNVGLPLKKQDVLDINTRILSTVKEKGQPEVHTELTFNTPRKEYKGCFDQLSPVLGLTYCGEISVPWETPNSQSVHFPLNGPSKLSLRIETDDVSSYHFRAQITKKDSKFESAELLLETPNSKMGRKLLLNVLRREQPHQQVIVTMKSPWKEVSFEGTLVSDQAEQSITAKLLNDGLEYSFKAGVKVAGDPNHKTYTPLLEYKSPDQKERIVAKKPAKGVKKPEKLTQDLSVHGSLTVDKTANSRKYTFNEVTLVTPKGEIVVDGYVSLVGSEYSADLKLSHDKKNLKLKGSVSVVSPTNWKVSAEVQSPEFPDLGVSLKWEHQHKSGLLVNDLVLVHGPNLQSQDTRLTINQYLHYRSDSAKTFDISTKNKVTYPIFGVDLKFDGSAKPKDIEYDLGLAFQKYKAGSTLLLKWSVKDAGDYVCKFTLTALDNSILFDSKRDVISKDKSLFVDILDIKPGNKYTLTTELVHVLENNNIEIQNNMVLKIDGDASDYICNFGLVENPQSSNTNLKVAVGSTTYIDIITKLAKGKNPNGNLKVFLKKYLDATAQFKYNDGKGSATLSIDVPKLNSKIKGTGDMEISGSKHSGSLDLYFADDDPKKTLHFKTDSDIKSNSIDSKNTVTVLGHTTVLNFKHAFEGKADHRAIANEVELTLPCGRIYTSKYSQNLINKPENSAGDLTLEIAAYKSKKSTPCKLFFDLSAKNVNRNKISFESNSHLLFDGTDGNKLDIKTVANFVPQGEKQLASGQISVEGSIIPQLVDIKLIAEIEKDIVSYVLNGAYGSTVRGTNTGKVSIGSDPKAVRQLDNTLELHLSAEKLRQLKHSLSVSFTPLTDAPAELVINNNLEWNKENTLKSSVDITLSKNEGKSKWVIVLPKEQPHSLETVWSTTDDRSKTSWSVLLNWEGNKEAKFAGDLELHPGQDTGVLNLKATTPSEKLKDLVLSITLKHHDSETKRIEGSSSLIINSKKYEAKGSLGAALGAPLIDVIVTSPAGTSKAYLNIVKKSDKEGTAELILHFAELDGASLNADADVKLDVDDFHLKLNVDSPKLNINKWHLEAGNKQVKGAKRIAFTATSADKTLLSGSTNIRSKTDGDEVSYSGSGQVKIKDQNHNFNFQTSKVHLTKEKNNEVGFEYATKLVIADVQSFESKLKLTNKEFYAGSKHCSQKKDCSVMELKSKLNKLDQQELSHEFGLTIDLKALNIEQGLSLSASTERKDWKLNQELELTLTKKSKSTYKYKAYLQETGSGLTITLPNRVISAELQTTSQNKGVNDFQRSISANVWLDKTRQPNSRFSLTVAFDKSEEKDGSVKLSGEIKLAHPSLEKDIVVKGRSIVATHTVDNTLEIDIFKKKDQRFVLTQKVASESFENNGYKVVSSLDIKSKGHNVDFIVNNQIAATLSSLSISSVAKYKSDKPKEAEFKLEATKDKLLIHAQLLNHHILHLDATVKMQDNLPSVDAEVHVLGVHPTIVHIELKKKGLVSFLIVVYRKATPESKVQATGGLDGGLDIEVTLIKGGEKRQLMLWHISTKDADFLASNFKMSSDDLKNLVEYKEKESEAVITEAREVSKTLAEEASNEANRLTDSLRKGQPNFNRLVSTYEQQLKTLKAEIETDKVLKEFSDALTESIGEVLKAISAVINGIKNTVEVFVQKIVELQDAVLESFKKAVPGLKEAFNNITQSLSDIAQALSKLISEWLKSVTQYLKKYEKEITEIVSLFRDFIKDVGSVLKKSVHGLYAKFVDFVNVFIEQLKELPLYAFLQERYEQVLIELKQLSVPQEGWIAIADLLDTVKDSAPTVELTEFLSAISTYLEKHIKKQVVNEREELKILYEKAVLAVKSLLKLLETEIGAQEQTKGLFGFGVPKTVPTAMYWPRIGAVRFSPILYVLSNGLPSLKHLYQTYRPSPNILKWIPPQEATGFVLDSHHFFTFDNRHVTFKGSCSYVLAQDLVDGNFSVVISLESGSLKSIAIINKGATLEILADKSLLVNGAPKEYPIEEGDLSAWREYDNVVMKSDYGVKVTCNIDINLCSIEVSGFYFGKTRGLLGTISNEEWDDFTLPDGTVASKAQAFGNGWKINPQCSDVSGVDHHEHNLQADECNKVLGGGNILSLCSAYVDPAPFIEACNHIAHEAKNNKEKQSAACNAAAVYVKVCRDNNILVNLPQHCVHCEVAGQGNVNVGQVFSVKVPQGAADILILLQQDISNNEVVKDLVSPIVNLLTTELKSRGISDVRIVLIGYGDPHHIYPIIYTSSNGKLLYDGKPKNIHFGDIGQLLPNLPSKDLESVVTWLQLFWEKVILASEVSDALALFPFRPSAAKAIISVVGKCPPAVSPSLVPLFAILDLYKESGIAVHSATPIDDVQVSGTKDGKSKLVVGFDKDNVYSTTDARKKPLEGNSELRKSLEYKQTFCTEATLLSGGTVFNTLNLKQNKKQYLQVVTQRIADSLTTVELQEDCTCVQVGGLHTRSVCTVSGAKEKERLGVKTSVKG